MMTIKVKTQFTGFHRWADAPDEVGFLRSWHRHIFKVKVLLNVTHDDRDLEFFIVQRELAKFIDNNIDLTDTGSCEMIARKIAKFHPHCISVEVSEDGENSAIYTKDL